MALPRGYFNLLIGVTSSQLGVSKNSGWMVYNGLGVSLFSETAIYNWSKKKLLLSIESWL